MKKYLLLCIMMVQGAAVGMDRLPANVWEVDELVSKIVGYVCNSREDVEERCKLLACCNKRLSAGIVFNEYLRCSFLPQFPLLHLNETTERAPLRFIAHRRLIYAGLETNKYLWAARHYLKNGHGPNDVIDDCGVKKTILHRAVELQDKKYVRLLLEHGGDPYKTVFVGLPGGPNCNFNAFHWELHGQTNCVFEELEHAVYTKDDAPNGWLKKMCCQVEAERKQIAFK